MEYIKAGQRREDIDRATLAEFISYAELKREEAEAQRKAQDREKWQIPTKSKSSFKLK